MKYENNSINQVNSQSNSKINKVISLYAEDKKAIFEIDEIKQADKYNTTELSINHSKLISLKGLELFENLIILDLSSNEITNMLFNYTINLTRLTKINLSCNYLSSLNGIENLVSLETADFSHNKIVNIESLNGLCEKNNKCLRSLLLEDNLLSNISQLNALVNFINLDSLVLEDNEDTNPICQSLDYIYFTKSNLKQVKILNNKDIYSYNIDSQALNNYNNNNDLLNFNNNENNLFSDNENDYDYLNFDPINNKSKKTKDNPFIDNYNEINLNNTNIPSNFPDIKYRQFKKTQTQSNLDNMMHKHSLDYLREENKNLSLNLQELFKDQKELIFKYEKLEHSSQLKEEELQNIITKLKNQANSNNTRYEDQEIQLREFKNKIELRNQEISSLSKKLENTVFDLNEANSKLALLKSDFDYLQIEKEKLSKRNSELMKDIQEQKHSIYSVKENYFKEENFYKDQLENKNHQVQEAITKTQIAENKIFNLTKQLSDKQSEIEILIQQNSQLNSNINKLTKEKSINETDLIVKHEKEKENLANKHKDYIIELNKQFDKRFKQKDEEFLMDISNIEKKFKENTEKFIQDIEKLEKDNFVLSNSSVELKNSLKTSEQTIKQLELTITELKRELNIVSNERNELKEKHENVSTNNSSKIKALESEIKDIFKENQNYDNQIKSCKKEIMGKDEEINKYYEENLKLKKDLIFSNSKIEKLESGISSLKQELTSLHHKYSNEEINKKINSLDDTIKTKNLILEDQSKQIISLKEEISKIKEENEYLNQELEKISTKFDKKLDSKQKELDKYRNVLEENKNLAEEYENEMKNLKEELDKTILEKQELEERLNSKEEIFNQIQSDFNEVKSISEKNSSVINNKNKEISKLEKVIFEMKKEIDKKENEIRDISEVVSRIKQDKELEIDSLKMQNNDLIKDLKTFIELREQEKKEFKMKLMENFNKLYD